MTSSTGPTWDALRGPLRVPERLTPFFSLSFFYFSPPKSLLGKGENGYSKRQDQCRNKTLLTQLNEIRGTILRSEYPETLFQSKVNFFFFFHLIILNETWIYRIEVRFLHHDTLCFHIPPHARRAVSPPLCTVVPPRPPRESSDCYLFF